MVTLSLRATGPEALSPRAQFALLDAFGDRLLAVNRTHRLSAKGRRALGGTEFRVPKGFANGVCRGETF